MRTTIRLPQQIWVPRNVNGEPSADKLIPVTNYGMKPCGGIWTSTYLDEGVCGWVQWCLDGSPDWVERKPGWLLEPRVADIYVIDSYSNLFELARLYGKEFTHYVHSLDFEAMRRDGIEAIHLTEAGQYSTCQRLDGWNLYGWDCESTIWFNWCFERVESLGTFDSKPAHFTQVTQLLTREFA